MAEISVPFTVPVQAIVDTNSGKVLRVVVVDEEISHDPNGYWGREDEGDLRPKLKAKALAVAEGDSMWPAWEFGF